MHDRIGKQCLKHKIKSDAQAAGDAQRLGMQHRDGGAGFQPEMGLQMSLEGGDVSHQADGLGAWARLANEAGRHI